MLVRNHLLLVYDDCMFIVYYLQCKYRGNIAIINYFMIVYCCYLCVKDNLIVWEGCLPLVNVPPSAS